MKAIIAVVGLVVLFSCKHAGTESDIKTDLTPAGNSAVSTKFNQYKSGGHRCASQGEGDNVIVTGFGLFASANYNISGAVVEAMARQDFWPANVPDIETLATPEAAGGVIGRGNSGAGTHGAAVTNRRLTIEGKSYNVCFMVLDVLWDLAAAIIVYEAKEFQPKFIMMSGRGGSEVAIFEGGAINQAMSYAGFDANGVQNMENIPAVANSYVLPGESFSVESGDTSWNRPPISIGMTWNNSALRDAVAEVVSGYRITAVGAARPSNNYICNNVSFVALQAAKNRPIILAGGMIRLPTGLSADAIGFFHYPVTSRQDASEMFTWAKALATSIRTQLP